MKPLVTKMRTKYLLASVVVIPLASHFMFGTSMFWGVLWFFIVAVCIQPEGFLIALGIPLNTEKEVQTNEK